MSVSFTFGAFGDIAVVLQLAWGLRKLLADASAFSKGLDDVIATIDSFTHALQSAKSALHNAKHVPPSVENGVRHALEVCTRLLSRIGKRIDSHRSPMVRRHGASIWKAYWAACSWTILGGKEELNQLKKLLNEQVDAIRCCWVL